MHVLRAYRWPLVCKAFRQEMVCQLAVFRSVESVLLDTLGVAPRKMRPQSMLDTLRSESGRVKTGDIFIRLEILTASDSAVLIIFT